MYTQPDPRKSNTLRVSGGVSLDRRRQHNIYIYIYTHIYISISLSLYIYIYIYIYTHIWRRGFFTGCSSNVFGLFNAFTQVIYFKPFRRPHVKTSDAYGFRVRALRRQCIVRHPRLFSQATRQTPEVHK